METCLIKPLLTISILGEIKEVAGSEMDVTKDTLLGDRLSQVGGGTGFDHNFCVGQPGVMKHVARYMGSSAYNVSKLSKDQNPEWLPGLE